MSTLNDLSIGDFAEISSHEISEAATRARLLALGFTRGARVRVVGFGPAGDLLLLKVHGSVIALRRSEAEYISVRAISRCEVPEEGFVGAEVRVPELH